MPTTVGNVLFLKCQFGFPRYKRILDYCACTSFFCMQRGVLDMVPGTTDVVVDALAGEDLLRTAVVCVRSGGP